MMKIKTEDVFKNKSIRMENVVNVCNIHFDKTIFKLRQ